MTPSILLPFVIVKNSQMNLFSTFSFRSSVSERITAVRWHLINEVASQMVDQVQVTVGVV